ncbi:ribosomal RNA-processing protein 8 [Phymastichus coffea]|uniref:ribosomal RNA-processing protein 8 n=1 Tax=Phymastichus coffea TaxID=108790 RepID=UPI00273B138D|nr:ribosomal RNA-processing protein 8 [Phymastichus coffea]
MSKKKKRESEFQRVSKNNNLKNVNSSVKSTINKFGGVSKIKNKQNIKDSVLLQSKKKQNIKDNVKTKFKLKNQSKIKNIHKLKYDNHKNFNANANVGKPNNQLKKLNIRKINALLNTKQVEDEKKQQKKSVTTLSLKERMLAQLRSSRFRFLNEQMYSTESSASQKYFQEDPNAFYAYHEGYKQQVKKWPVNPIDIIIESVIKMPKDHVIADFGCGEAKLADSVPQTVHSFDLVAINEKVKACDMAHTPLLTGRVNVVVFCLSLMGSNLGDYLFEANRVLAMNGTLKIAEVESRFDKVDEFIKLMTQYGFVNTWKDLSYNLFYFMDFKKTKDVLKKDAKKLPSLTLKPCLYKKR